MAAKDTIWDGSDADNDFTGAGNYDNGAPASTDSVFYRAIAAATGVDVAGGEHQAFLLADFNVEPGCGVIFGSRETPLHIDADSFDYAGEGAGGNIQLDNCGVLARVLGVGGPGDNWTFGLNLHGGTTASLIVDIPSSNHLAIAGYDDDAAVVTTLVHRNGTLTIGEGVTQATIYVEGGVVHNYSAVTTILYQSGGVVWQHAGAIAEIDGSGGTLYYLPTAMYTTCHVRSGFTLDLTKDGQARDISAKTTKLYKGGTIKLIPNRVTWDTVFQPQADVTKITAA